ncbi:MAG TPA: methyltransferase domain-containing protein [Candidatus Acidoferrales bacterium]|jgi:tRNA (cmo5U34)-methyltransferase|nr:methyltransferase domain-containing protein [Candidatus Acidoferrales bacterium]
MDRIKQHFEEEARDFDRIILTLIPHYPLMVEALVAALPFDSRECIRVIDLGCGTGTVAQHVLDVFPNAKVTCLDVAENMIALAQAKLARYPGVRFVVGDFATFDGDYDAVVSSLALHHLATDEDKRRFYRKIYGRLGPGGAFYNGDIVLASSDVLQATYMRQWRACMRRSISDEEIEKKWIAKYQAEDHPATLVRQLEWLTEIGFADVDVVWKHYNFAIYGGVKH